MHKIVCVTACPTGIAHTYMAAESLDKAGKSLGVHMIVETNGAIGVENKLKEVDIKSSVGVIIASDISIDKTRFKDKIIIETTTSEAIKDSKKLINQLLDQVKG
ncbi:MAG: PTS fructose transporter subunit IIB [Acholeplasmataceae bacterium]|jgi:PTS system fructose-specific IIC component